MAQVCRCVVHDVTKRRGLRDEESRAMSDEREETLESIVPLTAGEICAGTAHIMAVQLEDNIIFNLAIAQYRSFACIVASA